MTRNNTSAGKTGFLSGLILCLVVFGLIALLLEGALRSGLFFSGMDFDLEMWKYATEVKKVSDNPEIGHEHTPGTGGHFMGVDVQINSQGLRDVEHKIQKPADTMRILMLGDSLTFGWGVALEETLSRRLENSLNSAQDKLKIEVVNTGVGNYNTAQETEYFLTKGYEYDPDIVILNYFINDGEPTPMRKASYLVNNSMFAAFVSGRFDKMLRMLQASQDWRDYYRNLYAEGAPGWEKTKASIKRLADYCREKGILLLMAHQPELHQLKDYPFPEVNRKVEEQARINAIPYLDFLPHISEEEPSKLWVTVEDTHANGYANELFDKALSNWIMEQGFLKQAATKQ